MTTPALFARLESLLNRVEHEKRAFDDDSNTLHGKSTHETVLPASDGGEEDASTGSHAAEQEDKVDKMYPPDVVVNVADDKPSSPANATDNQLGTAEPTGEDPENEKPKGDRPKEDTLVSTTHPANASIGEKYSGWRGLTREKIAGMKLDELLVNYKELADESLAEMAVTKAAAEQKPAQTAQPKEEPVKAAADGANAADASITDDEVAASVVANIYKAAVLSADLTAARLQQQYAALQKNAVDPDGMDTDETSAGGGEGGGMPGGGPDPAAEALLAQMAGGGGEELPPEAMGGDPGMGGEPGMSEDQALQELIMAMEELGITPEDLMALMANEGGGMEGGMPPGGGMEGGMPPEGAPMLPGDAGPVPPDAGPKLAKLATDFRRSGKFQFSGAAPTKEARATRDFFKNFLRELVTK